MAKPPISQWIVDQRKAHGWKAEEVALRLREMGYDAEDTTYRTWEASRRPKPETIHGLELLFGSIAPKEEAEPVDLAALIESNRAVMDATKAFTEAVDLQTQKLDRVWDRLGDLIERLDRQQPLTKGDALAMAEGLADGIGASLAGSIADLAAALRQPSPAKPGGRG